MKTLATAILVGCSLLLAAPADARGKYTPKVSIEAARATALEKVPGKLIEEELEKEKGQWVYEFEIKPNGETGSRIKEVTVDPESGKIVAIEEENEDGAEGADDDADGDDDGDDDKNEQAKAGKGKAGKGKSDKKTAKNPRHTARR